MKTTRAFLLVLVAAVAGACDDNSTLVAPPESGTRSDAVQSTSSADTVSTELRGVHTFGGGN